MVTAITPRPQKLTRKELAEFLPNQRSIRAFEKLFDVVPTDVDDLIERVGKLFKTST